MKRNQLSFLSMVMTFGMLTLLIVGGNPAEGGEWKFPVGLTYANGYDDIFDLSEDNLEAQGYLTDSVEGLPVGLSFRPYYQLDNGLGFGLDLGPMMMIFGDVDFFNLPVNLNCRYTLNPEANISPYARAGLGYNFASGDYVEGKGAGFFGALGVEFLKGGAVSMGVEASFDTSDIEYEDLKNGGTDDIKPCGFAISIFAIF